MAGSSVAVPRSCLQRRRCTLRRCTRTVRLLLLATAIFAFISLSDSPRSFQLHALALGQLIAPRSRECQALASSSSPPLAEILDVSRAPLLWVGAQAGSQSSAHEREADFSSWLYAEGGALFFFDAAGPICATRVYWVVSRAIDALVVHGLEGAALDTSRAELRVEVDGKLAFAGTAASLFAGDHPTPFPDIFVRAPPPAFSEGGALLLTPLCAHSRLRLAWAFPTGAGHADAAMLLGHGDACVADDAECYLKFYFDASWLRPSPELASMADADLSSSSCSDLSSTQPTHVVFAAEGAGTVLALIFFPPPGSTPEDAHDAVHSEFVHLEAYWDVVGGAAAWEGSGGVSRGGALITPLSGLFGPAFMGLDGTRKRIHTSSQHTLGTLPNGTAYLALPAPFWHSAVVTLTLDADAPPTRLCSRVLATRRVGTDVGECSSTTPSGAAADVGNGVGGGVPMGYLQGMYHDILSRVMDENVMWQVEGVTGKLVCLTDYLEVRGGVFPINAAEGDLKIRTDASLSHSHWFTGYEDTFGASHTYQFDPERVHEAHFAHQRIDTVRTTRKMDARGSGRIWLHLEHPEIELWSLRLLTLDAIPFSWSATLLFEGFAGEYDSARARGVVLFYGVNTPRRPVVTDTLFPAEEEGKGEGEALPRKKRSSHHDYSITGGRAPPSRYELSSSIGGDGEPPLIDGSCAPVPHQRVEVLSCQGVRINLEALAISRDTAISFSLSIDPSAARVSLRRLFDLRYSVQRAELSLEGWGVPIRLSSSDRSYAHLDTHWREGDIPLPPAATRGRSVLHVQLRVLADEVPGRVYSTTHLGEEWTEARWTAICFY